MKGVVYTKYGSPDVLLLNEVEKPIPMDDEVLIKVRAASINSWDWDMLTGRPLEYRLLSGVIRPKKTKILGCDMAGTVEAIGENIKKFHPGDEVFGDLSEGLWGGFAEHLDRSHTERPSYIARRHAPVRPPCDTTPRPP